MNDLVEGCKITGNVLLDGEDIYKGMGCQSFIEKESAWYSRSQIRSR